MSAATIIGNTLLAAAGTAIVVIAALIRYTDGTSDTVPVPHEGWEQGHEGQLHDLATEDTEDPEWVDTDLVRPYVPRHDVDTFGWVVGGAPRRPAAYTDTQQIPAVDA